MPLIDLELPADAVPTDAAASQSGRGEMVAEMPAAVLRRTDLGEHAADRVRVLVAEVPDGFRGAGGQIVRPADSQAILGAAGAAA